VHDAQRGTSLIELMLVMIVLGVLLVGGVPRAAKAAEEARVDAAAATLRSLWHAQRLYRFETGVYARDESALVAMRLVEPNVFTVTTPFVYRLEAADDVSFVWEAERSDTRVWTGTLSVDEDALLSGQITDGDGDAIAPAGI